MHGIRLGAWALLLAVAGVACVSRSTYDAAVADGRAAHADVAQRQRQIDELTARLDQAERDAQARDRTIEQLRTDGHNLQVTLDDATAMNQSLRAELGRLGEDVDRVLSERGALATELRDAKARLAELRRAQAAAEARATLVRGLLERLRPLVDAGAVRVVGREGRTVLVLPADELFEPGAATLRARGRATLARVGAALSTVEKRRFQIGAHTDEAKLAGARFASDWELTSARAVAVVKALVGAGVKPEALSAAGYGAHDPIASGADDEARAENRRVEIALVPAPDELVAAPAP